jgi:hypothetical protein
MKSGIVLSMLLVLAGLFCPAAQAVGDAERTPPLTGMDAMLLAVRKAKQNNLKDPRRSAKWRSMTATQQEDALAKYKTRVAEWEKKPKIDWRGKKVNWLLRVEDVRPDKETDGYVLTATSREGYLAMAMFSKESQAQIASLKTGQSVSLVGTIEDYKDSGGGPRPLPARGAKRSLRKRGARSVVFLGVAVESIPAFGVKLKDPKLITGATDGVDIAGLTFNANNVIYLVDRSGSMVDTFYGIKCELLESIGRLGKGQRFQIVLLGESQPRALFKTCVLATPDNKVRTKKLLASVIARGQTKPIPAIQEAAKYMRSKKNTAVVLITDYAPEDCPAALKAAKDLGVPVHAILYGTKSKAGAAFMKSVAKETKGTYRYVPPRD